MTTLRAAAELGRAGKGLAMISTLRADGTIQASMVGAGVLPHPLTGQDVLGFVIYGSVKLRNLRARPQVTATFTAGLEWAAVEGRAELAGPDDLLAGLDEAGLRQLLREVFVAAGGAHDDWDDYDRVMAAERRVAVLITPTRVYSSAN